MKPTQIFMPQELISRIKALQEKTGLGFAEICRRALDEYLKRVKP